MKTKLALIGLCLIALIVSADIVGDYCIVSDFSGHDTVVKQPWAGRNFETPKPNSEYKLESNTKTILKLNYDEHQTNIIIYPDYKVSIQVGTNRYVPKWVHDDSGTSHSVLVKE